jgi:dTDP-4-amino-4,6-dideoxygalactose transaminase
MTAIPFNKPFLAGTELQRLQEAIAGGLTSGGPFTVWCEQWLQRETSASRALLAHSGTGAMEAATMLAELGPGDEAIMPSFGFPTTASAVVRQGATPVFVDIDPHTLNIAPAAVEAAIGERTKAVIAVHYGAVACAMDELEELCAGGRIAMIEDAAHCLLASYKGRPLGAIGRLASFSFHYTKNLSSGEGGALLINDPTLQRRAEIIWEKGTNRAGFLRGEVRRYEWLEIGSSFTASELTAAFLSAQLEVAQAVTAKRRQIWQRYHEAFAELEAAERLQRPGVPDGHLHNGHLYYLVLPTERLRDAFIADLRAAGIETASHYMPLHLSSAGRAHGRVAGELAWTERQASRLVRLPLYADLEEPAIERVIDATHAALGRTALPTGG